MYAGLIVLAASALCPCRGPNSTLRTNANVSLRDSEATLEAQRVALQPYPAGAWAGALEKLRAGIARDSEVWGLDDAPVVFDYALLAVAQKAKGEELEARRTALRKLSIPPGRSRSSDTLIRQRSSRSCRVSWTPTTATTTTIPCTVYY